MICQYCEDTELFDDNRTRCDDCGRHICDECVCGDPRDWEANLCPPCQENREKRDHAE